MGNGTHLGIEQGLGQIREATTQLLAFLRGAEVGDRETAALSLEAAASLGMVEQAAHGLRLQLLAQADRLRAARGGVSSWLAEHQGQRKGHARTLAHDARLLATVPQFAPDLASGELSTDAVRLLARTVKACKNSTMDPVEEVAATLDVTRAEGVSAAADHVRALEHRIDPGKVKNLNDRQRRCSRAGSGRLDNGMWLFEIQLDSARAAVLKAALDALIGSWLRAIGKDGIAVLPPDVKSTEQITAHAFYRLAQVFLAAPASLRKAPFNPSVVFFAPLPATEGTQDPRSRNVGTHTGTGTGTGTGMDEEIPVGCALTAYGDVVPLSAVGPVHDSTHAEKRARQEAGTARRGSRPRFGRAYGLPSAAGRTGLSGPGMRL